MTTRNNVCSEIVMREQAKTERPISYSFFTLHVAHKYCYLKLLLLLLLLWLYSPLLGLGRFFRFLILYTVVRTPWMQDQPVARPLPTCWTTQTQNKRTQYRHQCLWVGLEPTIPAFERAKTIHALDHVANVTGTWMKYGTVFSLRLMKHRREFTSGNETVLVRFVFSSIRCFVFVCALEQDQVLRAKKKKVSTRGEVKHHQLIEVTSFRNDWQHDSTDCSAVVV
jgi:hypothetical protein